MLRGLKQCVMFTALALGISAVSACGSNGSFLTPTCPALPTSPNIGLPGPEFRKVKETSVDLELSSGYLSEKIKAMTRPSPADTSGVVVKAVFLHDKLDVATHLPYLTIRMKPVLRNADKSG